MFKIGLENRDFCKSLHFYIVDAGKKRKEKKELHLLACSATLGHRAMPSLFVFLVLRGACQRPDIDIYIYIYMDSQKQLKLCRFPQRTCKLMRSKVVI